MSMRICSGETTSRWGQDRGAVLEMHQGSGAGTVAGLEKDGMGVPYRDHAHYGRQGTVVGAGTAAPQGGAGSEDRG